MVTIVLNEYMTEDPSTNNGGGVFGLSPAVQRMISGQSGLKKALTVKYWLMLHTHSFQSNGGNGKEVSQWFCVDSPATGKGHCLTCTMERGFQEEEKQSEPYGLH